MKKATTINEFANNLLSENLEIEKDANVYVPIYNEKLEALRDVILNDEVESQTFFVAGQSGTGKTTALNFLKTKQLEDHFFVKYINMRDFLDERDVDIIDFLLTFAFALVKDTALEEDYYEKLVEIQRKHEGELEEIDEKEVEKKAGAGTEVDASAGGGLFNLFNLKARFFAEYKVDTFYRKTTREIFKLKKPHLRDLINELIDKYREKVTRGKKLLTIVDDLDKLKEIQQINSIFLEHRNYIFDLKCKKIFSIPTYLTTSPEIDNYSRHQIPQFVLNLKSNPIAKKINKKREKEQIGENKKMLMEVIRCRIAEGIELIDDDALQEAVEFSGGIIRQLIRIVYHAAIKVRRLQGPKITKEDVEDGIEAVRNTIARTIISSNKIKMLNTILTKNIPVSETSEEFIEVLHANNVLAYTNGTIWYEVNPIIKETVEIYAERHGE
jgi:DNA polymerase III delta prime subunit